MDEDAVLKIATLVKVNLVTRIREDLKKGDTLEAILNRYEYSSFAMVDGNLVMVSGRSVR